MEECIKVTRHKDEKRIGISQDLQNQITFWKHSNFFFFYNDNYEIRTYNITQII